MNLKYIKRAGDIVYYVRDLAVQLWAYGSKSQAIT